VIAFAAASQMQLRAQFLPALQAQSPEEYDSYLDVLEAQAPEQMIEAAGAFRRQWPQSSLLSHVYQLEFDAHVSLGNASGAVATARLALSSAPENHVVRAGLALILANGARTPEQVNAAESEARIVLEGMGKFRAPRSLPFSAWKKLDANIRGKAHAALGLAAFKRDDISGAVRSFETAVALNPEPSTQLRLGKLYRVADRTADARKVLQAAAAGQDPEIRKLAEAELRDLVR
jgi:tetratricopeptide (TPR) repeat protein